MTKEISMNRQQKGRRWRLPRTMCRRGMRRGSGFTSVKPQSKEEKQKASEEHWAMEEIREKEFVANQEKLERERKRQAE
jgi:hypothetical protein